ncbi:MAG: phosphatase PAP2 family protein [Sedimentisphaerales bacterium]|nr:phosphatase PAP2 family protein [Sedimentisphaerales bacterium]
MDLFRRNAKLLKSFCIVLVLAGFCPEILMPPLVAEEAEKITFSHRASSLENASDSFWEDFRKIPDVVIVNTKEVATNGDYLFWLLLAGGGSIAMHRSGADRHIDEEIGKQALGSDLDKLVDMAGGPGYHFAAAGLWYLVSADRQNSIQKERAWTMLKALTVTGALTVGLKVIRNNDTPNGKSFAWPSGHTSSSFAVASVLDEFYGPQVGIPAYLGAGFVGYRMMDSGDHWASDVLFGGVLGYIVGHHVAGKHQELDLAGFKMAPLTSSISSKEVAGLSFVKKF